MTMAGVAGRAARPSAAAIICLTSTGFTVRSIARFRPDPLAAELDVGLVDDRRGRRCGRRATRTASTGCAFPVGLFGEHTNTTSGRASTAAAIASSDSENPSSNVSDTTPVCVSHAIRECSRYVGSNTATPATRAAVGLQELRQDLVRTVRRPRARRTGDRRTWRAPRGAASSGRRGTD